MKIKKKNIWILLYGNPNCFGNKREALKSVIPNIINHSTSKWEKILDPSLKSSLDFTKAIDQVSCKTTTLTVVLSVQESVWVRDTQGESVYDGGGREDREDRFKAR